MNFDQGQNQNTKQNVDLEGLGFFQNLRWNFGLLVENARVILPYSLGHLFRKKDPKFRVPSPDQIQNSISILAHTETGPIIEISFSGRYPPGSFGNEHANRMRTVVASAIQEQNPVAVLLNLNSVNYVWGDSILGIMYPLADLEMKTFLPGCIFASGRTASALEGILKISGLFEIAGIGFFREHEKAVEFLEMRVTEGAV